MSEQQHTFYCQELGTLNYIKVLSEYKLEI